MTVAKRKAGCLKKRVLVVDDHPMMRQGLAALVNAEPDLMICCEAENAAQAVQQVAQAQPDLVLADITLPDRSGLELIKDLQAMRPELPVLVVSMHDESVYAERVLRAGGRGYIMKQEGGRRMMEAIRAVLSGRVYVSEKMSARILEVFSGRRASGSGSPVESLSDRELEVFELFGGGRSTREIAELLRLSVKTVEVHRIHIKAKLGVRTAAELIREAVRWVESVKQRG